MAQAWFSHGRNLGFGIALPGFSKLTFPLYFFCEIYGHPWFNHGWFHHGETRQINDVSKRVQTMV